MKQLAWVLTLAALVWTPGALAQTVVVNSGFEAMPLADGGLTINTFGGGWMGLAGGNAGLLNPTTSMFTSEAPEGMNIAYSNGRDICQTIGVVSSGGVFRGWALAGARLDVGGVQNCGVELRSTSGVRCRGEANPAPIDGFAPIQCSFASGSPDLDAGQPLEICLTMSGFLQCNFDDAQAGEELFLDGFESGDTSAWAMVAP